MVTGGIGREKVGWGEGGAVCCRVWVIWCIKWSKGEGGAVARCINGLNIYNITIMGFSVSCRVIGGQSYG